MRRLLVLAIPFSLVCASPPALEGDPFPVATQGLSVPSFGDGAWSIETLLREYARVTGQNVLLEADTRTLASTERVGLLLPTEVPVENIHSFVEGILFESDFVLSVVHAEAPRILAVHSMQTGARQRLRNKATYVPREQLNTYASHPAIMVMTTLNLPKTDVRTLSNSLRTILTDANTQQIIPVGSSNSLILVGFGPSVVKLVQMLEDTEANAPEHGEGLVPVQGAEDR